MKNKTTQILLFDFIIVLASQPFIDENVRTIRFPDCPSFLSDLISPTKRTGLTNYYCLERILEMIKPI